MLLLSSDVNNCRLLLVTPSALTYILVARSLGGSVICVFCTYFECEIALYLLQSYKYDSSSNVQLRPCRDSDNEVYHERIRSKYDEPLWNDYIYRMWTPGKTLTALFPRTKHSRLDFDRNFFTASWNTVRLALVLVWWQCLNAYQSQLKMCLVDLEVVTRHRADPTRYIALMLTCLIVNNFSSSKPFVAY